MIAESSNAALVIILTGIIPIIFLNRMITRKEKPI
jgi:iron(III) transport system permease protein